MVELNFPTIIKKLKDFKIPHIDLVVGIGSGGIVPACLVAYKANCDLRLIKINYRDEENRPQYPSPVILNETSIPEGVYEIMIVDDLSVSGKTLLSAKTLLKRYRVKSFVLVGKADYVLFPKISECVKWPWKVDF